MTVDGEPTAASPCLRSVGLRRGRLPPDVDQLSTGSGGRDTSTPSSVSCRTSSVP